MTAEFDIFFVGIHGCIIVGALYFIWNVLGALL
jgi:hypothetical protein